MAARNLRGQFHHHRFLRRNNKKRLCRRPSRTRGASRTPRDKMAPLFALSTMLPVCIPNIPRLGNFQGRPAPRASRGWFGAPRLARLGDPANPAPPPSPCPSLPLSLRPPPRGAMRAPRQASRAARTAGRRRRLRRLPSSLRAARPDTGSRGPQGDAKPLQFSRRREGAGGGRAPGLAGSRGVADPRPATRDPGRDELPATRDPERPGPGSGF